MTFPDLVKQVATILEYQVLEKGFTRSIHIGKGDEEIALKLLHDWRDSSDQISKEDRIEISSCYPYQMSYGDHVFITVSATKPVWRIANDIIRRFLPLYREHLVVALRHKAQHDGYVEECRKNTDVALAALKGMRPSRRSYTSDYIVHFSKRIGDDYVYGDVTISGKTGNLSLRCPFESMEPVLTAIANAFPPGKDTEDG